MTAYASPTAPDLPEPFDRSDEQMADCLENEVLSRTTFGDCQRGWAVDFLPRMSLEDHLCPQLERPSIETRGRVSRSDRASEKWSSFRARFAFP